MEELEFMDALFDMVSQFAFRGYDKKRKKEYLCTGGLSALEHAFKVLHLSDPIDVDTFDKIEKQLFEVV